MSPCILPMSSKKHARPPVLCSISTVVIDSFETPEGHSVPHLTSSISVPIHQLRKAPPTSKHRNSRFHAPNNKPLSIQVDLANGAANPRGATPYLTKSPTAQAMLQGKRSHVSQTSRSSPPLSPTLSPSGPTTPQRAFFTASSPSPDAVERLGGSALYSLIGARVWLPPHELRTIVDRAPPVQGSTDLPLTLEQQLHLFGRDIWDINEGPGTRMARARIAYDGDLRLYQPVVKASHRTMRDVLPSSLFGAEYVHVGAPDSPEDMAALIADLDRLARSGHAWRPKLVFEPTPLSCHAGQREWLERIAPRLHVLSPNHEEFLSFYSRPRPEVEEASFKPELEGLMRHFLCHVGIGAGDGILVVRCGGMGCCVGTKKGGLRWFPAFFRAEDRGRVRDVTGAGNSFLGGYVAGLHLSDGDPYEAALYGTVSASFVVEQPGLPDFVPFRNEKEVDLWNGVDPQKRLEELRRRIKGEPKDGRSNGL